MVRTLHHDDVLLLGGVPGKLDRGLDCFGPGIPEEEGVEGLVRHQRQQRLDEFEIRSLEGDVDLGVHHLPGLHLSRLGHGRVAVPEIRDPDPAGEIEHLAAAHHGHVAAAAALYHLGRQPADSFGDMAGAEFGELGHTHVDYEGPGWNLDALRGQMNEGYLDQVGHWHHEVAVVDQGEKRLGGEFFFLIEATRVQYVLCKPKWVET